MDCLSNKIIPVSVLDPLVHRDVYYYRCGGSYLTIGLDIPFAHLPWRAMPGTTAQGYSTNRLSDYMTNFSLRPAQESESRQIKDLIHLVGINPMGLDWKRFVVAVNAQDQVVGTGQIKPHGKEILELASIAVTPEYQGKGIARGIIEYLLKDSPRPLYLTCLSTNGSLYQKFGFVGLSYDEMPRYFQRLSKVANVMMTFAREGEHLLVMKLQ